MPGEAPEAHAQAVNGGTGCGGAAGANAAGAGASSSAQFAAANADEREQQITESATASMKDAGAPRRVVKFLGIVVAAHELDHDGYTLKRPVGGTGSCSNDAISVNRTGAFDEDGASISGLLEFDLTQAFNLSPASLFRIGGGIGATSINTNIDRLTIQGGLADPDIFLSGGSIDEDNVQLDAYALYAYQRTYFLGLISGTFGEADFSSDAVGNNPAGNTILAATGSTDVRSFTLSGRVGHVIRLSNRSALDVSGGLRYYDRTADAFQQTRTDGSAGARYGESNTEEFTGLLKAKLSTSLPIMNAIATPYLTAGLRHRFTFDSTVSITQPGLATANYDFDSDDTFWQVGGGLQIVGTGEAVTLQIQGDYEASDDSEKLGGQLQFIVKLN